MRHLKSALLAIFAIVLVTIALANRDPLTIRLLPEALQSLFGIDWEVTLPAFVILLVAVLLGVLLGFVWEWVREHRYRAAAAEERRRRERLEAEVQRKDSREEDDIVALVDARTGAR